MIAGEHLCARGLAQVLDKSRNSLRSIFSSFRDLHRREVPPEKEDPYVIGRAFVCNQMLSCYKL
jgi:hypothetical protein